MKRLWKTLFGHCLLWLLSIGLLLTMAGMGWSQPWTYDFGIGTAAFTSGITAPFTPNPATGGGTNRVRIGTGAGSFNLENSGLVGFGSQTEMRGVAPTGGSVNKFSIFDYTAGKSFYTKFDVLLGSSAGTNTAASGTWHFFQGDGSDFSSSGTFTSVQVFTGVQWIFGAGGKITTNYRNGGSWTALPSSPFIQGAAFIVEIVGNNTASTINYTYSTAQSVAANRFDLWINGVLVGNDLAKGQLGANVNIDSWMFFGENSAGNVANIFLDNFTYNNTIPAIIKYPDWAQVPTVNDLIARVEQNFRPIKRLEAKFTASTYFPSANSNHQPDKLVYSYRHDYTYLYPGTTIVTEYSPADPKGNAWVEVRKEIGVMSSTQSFYISSAGETIETSDVLTQERESSAFSAPGGLFFQFRDYLSALEGATVSATSDPNIYVLTAVGDDPKNDYYWMMQIYVNTSLGVITAIKNYDRGTWSGSANEPVLFSENRFSNFQQVHGIWLPFQMEDEKFYHPEHIQPFREGRLVIMPFSEIQIYDNN